MNPAAFLLTTAPGAEVLEPEITGPGAGPTLTELLPVLLVILALLAVAGVGVAMAVRRGRQGRT